jgi:hypothetical protein
MTNVLVGICILTTILGLTTTAHAGMPPFMWEYFSYNVISSVEPNVVIDAPQDEPCIWGVMTACSEDEIGYFPPPPYDQKVWIDGEKIVLLRFAWTDTEGIFGYPGLKWRAFYHIFEAGYFDVGLHEIIHEIWVQKPYYGDEVYGWRLYATLTYTLNITGPL